MILSGRYTVVAAGYLDVRVLAQLICAGKTGRASAHNDDVALSVLIQILEVARGHGTADLHKLNVSNLFLRPSPG